MNNRNMQMWLYLRNYKYFNYINKLLYWYMISMLYLDPVQLPAAANETSSEDDDGLGINLFCTYFINFKLLNFEHIIMKTFVT